MPEPVWSIALHGGAGQLRPGSIEPAADALARAGLGVALRRGAEVLARGGSALDAVTGAVAALEDDPAFNAGRGAVLTRDGGIELDAAVMDGNGCHAGAVAGVSRVRNPVELARRVMEHSPHVLLAREGAEAFAAAQGLPFVERAWFETAERRRQWREFRAMAERGGDHGFDADIKYGTVGAVARDSHGHLAAATSTGGLTGKRWGRIGDSPVPGAGTWADDRTVAVSCTGAGEAFLRAVAAHELSARIRHLGEDAAAAAQAALADVAALGGKGGLVWAAADGATGAAFTTPGMFRASIDSAGRGGIAIYADSEEARLSR